MLVFGRCRPIVHRGAGTEWLWLRGTALWNLSSSRGRIRHYHATARDGSGGRREGESGGAGGSGGGGDGGDGGGGGGGWGEGDEAASEQATAGGNELDSKKGVRWKRSLKQESIGKLRAALTGLTFWYFFFLVPFSFFFFLLPGFLASGFFLFFF